MPSPGMGLRKPVCRGQSTSRIEVLLYPYRRFGGGEILPRVLPRPFALFFLATVAKYYKENLNGFQKNVSEHCARGRGPAISSRTNAHRRSVTSLCPGGAQAAPKGTGPGLPAPSNGRATAGRGPDTCRAPGPAADSARPRHGPRAPHAEASLQGTLVPEQEPPRGGGRAAR